MGEDFLKKHRDAGLDIQECKERARAEVMSELAHRLDSYGKTLEDFFLF